MSAAIEDVITEMIRYNAGDPFRVQHALKVYAFAQAIAKREKLGEKQRAVLEAAAVLHDIGIHNSEVKYGSCSGKQQEAEGPGVARRILLRLGAASEFTDRVCFLVGHHHTYSPIDGPDHQILVEADFLVNLFEGGLGEREAHTVAEKYFRTEAGKEYLANLYFSKWDPAEGKEKA